MTQASKFPITNIDKDEWNKKVSACLMYTIPSEDEALPILIQFEEILDRLMSLPIEQTLADDLIQYFFVNVFTITCQKIIKSRYFKNQTVLKKANRILELSACLLAVYPDILDKIPQFIDVFQSVFPTDQFYFKTNNQMTFQPFPYMYFNSTDPVVPKYQIDQKVDVLKFTSQQDKFIWTYGTVVEIQENDILISYERDYAYNTIKVENKNIPYMVAPHQTKCKDWEWRNNIKAGDLVDVLDNFGAWYNATVTSVLHQQDGRKKVDVTLKVYNQFGNKTDENGKFFGFSDYAESYGAFSAELSPYCSIAKEFNYDSSKSQFDYVDDFNDNAFTEFEGKRIYALPRKKYLSELIFTALNHFGQLKGFQKVMKKIQQKRDISMLSSFLKGLGGVEAYLHKSLVVDLLSKIKALLASEILSDANSYSKQKSEMLFSGLRSLLKRVYTTQIAYEFENNLKIKLVEQNFQHSSLKKKLLGLNELKQIVKSLTYGSARNKKIIKWIKDQEIFEKIYLVNSHVQLIKKSESFFRYIINEHILEVEDLEKLLKMAQKGDYQTRISLYWLFQEVSHIFKKNHVDFLIDKILESQPSLILNEDIDLLHELSKYSNYFPTKKVMTFFEKLTLGEEIPSEINSYAIKKYSDMVAKNYEMKPFRKQLIHDLLGKMKSHDIQKVTKILKFIFQNIGFGEWGKKDLSQMLIEEQFDAKIIQSVKEAKNSTRTQITIQESMNLLLGIYNLCSTYKIQIKTVEALWAQVYQDKSLLQQFFKWTNKVFKCEQGIQTQSIQDLEVFFEELFKQKPRQNICLEQLQLVKSIFVEVNKRRKYLNVSNIMKDKEVEKEYKRKGLMKQLKFLDTIKEVMNSAKDEKVCLEMTHFFIELYSSGQNSDQQIKQFLAKNIDILKLNSQKISHKQGQVNDSSVIASIKQALKLIELIIDDSEKSCSSHIESLVSKKRNYDVKLNIINSVSYSCDNNVKKMEVSIPVNFTLFELRAHLAKELDIPWRSVRLEYSGGDRREISFLKNCRTIKQLGLTGMETLNVTRKATASEPEADIILNGQINPQAIRAFRMIFDQYATDEQMNKAQCHEFTVKCLGSSSSPKFYENKINELFKEYDQNQDDLLTFEDFLNFYKNAAINRPSTVWSNLKSFGVEGNFKFSYEADGQIEQDNLPRNIMSKMPQIYEILFKLLVQEELASQAFDLLERLPVSMHMQKLILSVGEEEFNFQEMLNSKDLYIFFYKLNIIISLTQVSEFKTEDEKEWISRFISSQGFERLIQKLFNFIQSYNPDTSKRVELEIIDSLVQLLGQYLIKCFASPNIFECLALFTLEVSLDDKIQYLVTGAFPNKQTTLKFQVIEQEYVLEGYTKQQISKHFLDILEKLWPRQTEKNYFQQAVTIKILMLLPVVLIDQDFTLFMSKLKSFIEISKDLKKLQILYSMIMCIAFYSSQGQKVIVSQMFKHLTTKNIISEHFGILAVLVSKYGVSEINQEGIVNVLTQNIFSSHNELTIQGCSRLMLNFDLKGINEAQFDRIWTECLFNEQQDKRINKNSTREALLNLLLKASDQKPEMTDYIIKTVQQKISECIEHMRITSCIQDNQKGHLGYVGLKNMGNTCYINSMMQQLFMNRKFRYLIFRIKDNQPQVMQLYKEKLYDDNILHQFQRTFAYLEKTTRADYIPAGFCLAYKPFGESVNVMVQQDVQEFVSMFFDQLENKIKETPFKAVLETFYGGKTTNLFTCHDCHQTKKVEENFYSISLEVKNSKSLGDSFNRYISGELISDFRCSFCDKKVDVSKQTRISKPPRTLIIHLQRIVFNLDTFINEKITTRHEFPMDLDLYPYSLTEFQKPKEITPQDEAILKQSMKYKLSGIVCHIGNAESGHYISYIKQNNDKWVEFNDGLVMSFNSTSIETECFGGVASTFVDQFEWDRTSQTTKSAYVLLYQKQGDTNMQVFLRSQQDKMAFLKQYDLAEVIEKVKEVGQSEQKQSKIKKPEEEDESEEISESESAAQDKMQKELERIQQYQIMRKKSKDLDIDLEEKEKMHEISSQIKKEELIPVAIHEDVNLYLAQGLQTQINQDNNIHFFERNLASPAFINFFAHLLRQEHGYHEDIIKSFKSLTFGFWMKSKNFKDLLKTCSAFIQKDPKYVEELIFSNPLVVTLLIQNPDADVRTAIAEFLANSFDTLIKKYDLKLDRSTQLDNKIADFLENLFSLIPTTVSKCWTKFGQYFEFWYEFAKKGDVQLRYTIKIQVLKHFLDYFLDKKSPLKIYENKPQIGSKYANPNFSYLLKTVTYLISEILNNPKFKLSKDDYTLLIHFDCMEKLISESYENLAVGLVKQICRNNLYASQKMAIILIKGLHKSTFNNVQSYLDVAHAYILIDDAHQLLRIKWVMGRAKLSCSTISKAVEAMNSYSLEERVYTYYSSISLEQSSSLLDPIYQLYRRAENFALMCLKEVLRLCKESKFVFDYVWNLPPPTLCYGNIFDFYDHFIERYIEEAKRSHSYSHMGFNKEQLGNEVKKIYDELVGQREKPKQSLSKEINKAETTNEQIVEEGQIVQEKQSIEHPSTEETQAAVNPSASSEPNSPIKVVQSQSNSHQKSLHKAFYPVTINFKEAEQYQMDGLKIIRHESEIVMLQLEPTGKGNDSLNTSGMKKNLEKIKEQVWETKRIDTVEGFYVFNDSRNLLRIQTDEGTQLVKINDHSWVWASKILRVWDCQRTEDWPKWSLYSLDQNMQTNISQ